MPSGQALAATFDRALAYAYGQVVGSEARGEGFNEWLGPGGGHRPHAAGRPPARGRGRGSVPGRQHLGAGDPRRPEPARHLDAQALHRLQPGLRPDRLRRRVGAAGRRTSVVSERALQEIYEAPFRIAVQQGGVDSVMCSYNQINGVAELREPDDARRPQAGRRLQRVRGPGLRVRGARSGGRRAGRRGPAGAARARRAA